MTKSKTIWKLPLVLCCLAAPVLGCGAAAPPTAGPPGVSAAGIPYTPSLDPEAMDRSVDPCVDLYTYACGGWQKHNPIPPDQSRWDVYRKMDQDNIAFLRRILEQASVPGPRDAVTQKIGDFYAACMDQPGVNARGLAAIKAELDDIAAMTSKKDLAPVIARLQLATGDPVAFGGASAQDLDNSDVVIAEVDQGGLGLPDRDYYVKDDPKSKETRERYLAHVHKLFELLGEAPDAAQKHAETVMRIETALARASWTNVELREPTKLRNKMTPAQLQTAAPSLDWTAYFHAVAAPAFTVVNTNCPQFLTGLDKELQAETLDDWKSYLRFHLADSYSPYLADAFARESFDFHGAYLRGAKEDLPRWKRCTQLVNDALGEAVGQIYVRKTFGEDLKRSTHEMVDLIESAMADRVRALDWMSPATKERALQKLHTIRNKIGYPDKWRDYSSVQIAPTDLAGDVRNAVAFEVHRQWNKIGKPVERDEWGMTPQMVNAYFSPQMNDINFPAAVLQPPLYDAKLDDAPNYGNTGGTIGHELTHGFDDEGRQFDSHGNLVDWWTKDDAAQFEKRTKCVSDQFSSYVAVDEVHVNGDLTMGENVADLGGELLAWDAWKQATRGKKLENRDGLTPDQRFFVGFAQWACSNARPEAERLLAQTNPHAPERYRINGVVVNMPEFAAAFSCKPGQAMVKPKDQVCRVW